MGSTGAILLREALPSDAAAMAALRMASHWQGGAEEDRMARYLAGVHHPRAAAAERAAFLAEEHGRLLGFIAGHRTRRLACNGELQWFLVSPSRRGGPIAGMLFARLAGWFAERNIRKVCVNVAPDNLPARRFYRRHSAVELSDHWMVWDDVAKAGAER